MGLFGGSKPTPYYRGQTFRREVVNDISPYAGAWRNQDSNNTLGNDYRVGAGSLSNNTHPVARFRGGPVTKGYRSARLSTNSVYGAKDGSFLQSVNVHSGQGYYGNIKARNAGSIHHKALGLKDYETNAIVRYVEDPNGTFGVSDYNGRDPSKFANLEGYDIATTSDKTNISQKGEPKAAAIAQNAKKRKSSIGTSKFKIDIGGTTRTSGLGIPTV